MDIKRLIFLLSVTTADAAECAAGKFDGSTVTDADCDCGKGSVGGGATTPQVVPNGKFCFAAKADGTVAGAVDEANSIGHILSSANQACAAGGVIEGNAVVAAVDTSTGCLCGASNKKLVPNTKFCINGASAAPVIGTAAYCANPLGQAVSVKDCLCAVAGGTACTEAAKVHCHMSSEACVAAALTYDACQSTDGTTAVGINIEACACGDAAGNAAGVAYCKTGEFCQLTYDAATDKTKGVCAASGSAPLVTAATNANTNNECAKKNGTAKSTPLCICGDRICEAGMACVVIDGAGRCKAPGTNDANLPAFACDATQKKGLAAVGGSGCICTGAAGTETECDADEFCLADAATADVHTAAMSCDTTNQSAAAPTARHCNCGNQSTPVLCKSTSATVQEFCKKVGTTSTCEAAELADCTKTNGTEAAPTTGCACGTDTICTSTADASTYCSVANGTATCLAEADKKIDCVDGDAAQDAECWCGSAVCGATHFCLTDAETATKWVVVDKLIGARLVTAQETAAAALATAEAAKASATTCTEDLCDCDDSSAGGAACVGNFVATMSAAMNM